MVSESSKPPKCITFRNQILRNACIEKLLLVSGRYDLILEKKNKQTLDTEPAQRRPTADHHSSASQPLTQTSSSDLGNNTWNPLTLKFFYRIAPKMAQRISTSKKICFEFLGLQFFFQDVPHEGLHGSVPRINIHFDFSALQIFLQAVICTFCKQNFQYRKNLNEAQKSISLTLGCHLYLM